MRMLKMRLVEPAVNSGFRYFYFRASIKSITTDLGNASTMWQWNEFVSPLIRFFNVDVPDLIFFGTSYTTLLESEDTEIGPRHKRFIGTRKLISKEFVTSSDGRNLEIGEYEWQTYGEVFGRACNFASGLVRFSHDVDTRVAIYAEICAQWFIAFQGCFR
ncbi:uncharacterized protein LOC120076018 isoform X2 [Benincasa hispida]|uniref:uncharacterized protein LOC120076018 isoform X2 n=1 Tax=Benincasa hispida TaxID=102211 RepID=UPI00190156F7|nr:uncharacterized protein LOC120076018 isoform X2 [Benincasa hispida]